MESGEAERGQIDDDHGGATADGHFRRTQVTELGIRNLKRTPYIKFKFALENSNEHVIGKEHDSGQWKVSKRREKNIFQLEYSTTRNLLSRILRTQIRQSDHNLEHRNH